MLPETFLFSALKFIFSLNFVRKTLVISSKGGEYQVNPED